LSGAFVRLAVLGDPLRHTRSPDLHRAGLVALGLEGESVALPTPAARLGERVSALARDGFRGCNVTAPLKQAILEHVPRVSPAAAAAHSVNTVGFEADGAWGDTTDGAGFVAWLAASGRSPAGARVHLLGAGGAARSLALALRAAGATVTASARRPAECADAWAGLGQVLAWRGDGEAAAITSCDVLVNATPLEAVDELTPVQSIPTRARVVDLRYGPEVTPWIRAWRARGGEGHDGLGLLVHQARLSLERWFGAPVPLAPLERAVGWPR
jgi:shikimate dehydrogenase